MKASLRLQINKFTEDVINQMNIDIPVEEPEELVEKIGGRLVFTRDLPLGSSGQIKKCLGNSSEDFIIEVQKSDSKERANFTVAHELGHLFLHMGYKLNPEVWNNPQITTYQRSGNSEIEYEANEFAAALLMPRAEYQNKITEYTRGNKVDISKVAKYFHVSIDAAVNRGRWLNYLAW